MGKWHVFALRAASSLIWGGWGFSVPFDFVQDCSFSLPEWQALKMTLLAPLNLWMKPFSRVKGLNPGVISKVG